jgi:WD40 repeat protein
VALPGDPLNDLTWSAGGQALALIFGNLHAGDAWEGRWVHCRLPGSVWRLAASPDGHTLALVEYRGVILGELHEDHLENVRVLPHRAQPLAAAFLPDGRSVLTAGHDRYLHLWNLEPDQPPLLVGRHEREIWDLAVSADGETAATVGDDRWVALWDIPRRRLRACFRAEGPMIRLSMDPAATFVATGDEAGRPVILRQAPAP